MEITEVRIKLMDDPQDRLQAFCSITLNACFVIRDLKIIQGTKGPFVAMPSRKLTDRCPRCHTKNHLRAHYCNDCGAKLDEERATRDAEGRAKLYADIAHPINSHCRDMIQERVLVSFAGELEKAKLPGYVCTYDDYGEERYARLYQPDESEEEAALAPTFVAGADGARHRIEPAAQQTVPAHHGADADPRRNPAPTRSNMAVQTAENEEDDAFGAGLV